MPKNALEWIASILVVIGGVNWGLVGALNFNLVDTIFGVGSVAVRIVYILVGVSALYGLFFLFKKQETVMRA
mgnify:CR=1 FL=1